MPARKTSRVGDERTVSESEPEGFDFRRWPFYWLARADREYLVRMEKALKRAGLDIPRWRVLMVLHDAREASVSEIADHAISSLSTMMKIVQRMQADDLVSCRPNPQDGRVTLVTLTAAGRAAATEAWRIADQIHHRAFAAISEAERTTLMQLLEKLSTALSRY